MFFYRSAEAFTGRINRFFTKKRILPVYVKYYSVSKPPSQYCVDLVKQHDYENFLCTLLLSNACRSSAFAIRAFNIEVAKVQDQVSDPRIGQMRMKFWEETVDKLYNDKPPEHPVALELYKATKRKKLSKRYLKRLITSRTEQLTSSGFSNMEASELYAENSVSSVYYLLLEAAGIENVHADHAASHLGKAHGIVNLIRAVPYNAQRRTITLPQDMLLQHNVSHETLLRLNCTTGLKEVMFDVATRAKYHLDKARALRKNVPKAAFTIFLPAVAIDSYLERLRKQDFDVFTSRLQSRSTSLPFTLFWKKVLSGY